MWESWLNLYGYTWKIKYDRHGLDPPVIRVYKQINNCDYFSCLRCSLWLKHGLFIYKTTIHFPGYMLRFEILTVIYYK